VAILIIIFGFVLSFTNVLDSQDGTITFISLSLICEVISVSAIFNLFLRDIENKEYDNLKIIGEVRQSKKI
jgi:hypothetical protein